MFLERLELQGFKSFAQKTSLTFPQVVGNQKRGVTSIVGPNGSGKSNIADGVRWVLGEQSLKTLRGKKSEDVIFTGSQKKSRLGMAEVSLYLNNQENRVPIDYSEIVITRRLYRSGESEYLINKQKARLADINLMMAKANFGTKSYAIIGQGMVESILVLTQQEKKEFFDEAAGVRQFQIKRDDAINKLRRTEDNLYEAEMLLAEITPRLRSLTRSVNRLKRREELEKELERKRIQYYSFHLQKLTKERDKFFDSYQELLRTQEKRDEEVKRLQQEIGKYDKLASRTDVFNELQEKYQKFLNEKNELRHKKVKLESQIEVLKRTSAPKEVIIPLEKIILELEKIDTEQGKLISDLKNAENLDRVHELASKLDENHQAIVKLIDEVRNPSGTKDEIKIDQSILIELEAVEKKISNIETEIADQQKRITLFNKEEEEKNKSFFNLQKDLQEKQLKLSEIVNEVNNLKVELTRVDTKKEDLIHEIKEEVDEPDTIIKNGNKVTELDEDVTLENIHKLKHQLELIGGIDPETEKDYEETKKRHDHLFKQSADLKEAIKSLAQAVKELDERIKKQFNEAFNSINNEFQKYFKILFSGGSAKLIKILPQPPKKEEQKKDEENGEEQEEEEEEQEVKEEKRQRIADKLSDTGIIGVDIHAHPPGKKLKNVGMLSGGERAMTAIALICAIISNNPSPFVFLDEVDAALDEVNSERFAKIIDDLSTKTQFIIITHNRATMLKSKILYGTTMGDDGVSKIISLELKEVDKVINSKGK